MNFNFLRAIQFQPFERASGARWWGAEKHRDDSWQLSRTLLRCFPSCVFRDVSGFSKALQAEKMICGNVYKIYKSTELRKGWTQQTHCIHGCCFQKTKYKVTMVGGWGWSMPHVTFDHLKGHVMTWSAWQKSKRAAGVGMWKHYIKTYLEIIK